MIVHVPISHIYGRLTAVSVAGLWQGAVFALLATGLLRWMPRASASLKHAWLITIFALAGVLPWLHLGTIRAQAVNDHAFRIPPWMAATVAGVWLTVALIRVTRLFVAWRHLHSVRQRAVPLTFEGTYSYTVGHRQALLCTSAEVHSPTIIGFLHPRLLLPDWMAPQLTAGELHQIALHECEHLRRYDDWLNLLLQIGLILSPLNPALVWLDQHVSMQRELACDAAVVASTTQPIVYATCLTRLAEQRRIQRNRLMLALAAIGRSSELGQRVHALLDQSATWTQKRSRLAGVVTVSLLLVGAFGLAQTPSFIQISPAPQTDAVASDPALALTAGNEHGTPGHIIATRMTAAFRALPVSFVVQPSPVMTLTPHPTRTLRTPRQANLRERPVASQRTRSMLTSATVSPRPRRQISNLTASDRQATARFVVADFSSPYVVVPVENGWLIFQL
jgi:beta-lactamase regulating signal transducer with metallopeptidase domain